MTAVAAAVSPSPVLLHGFAASSAAWGDRIVDGLAAAGLPPVLLDAPGHGSRAGDADPSAFTLGAVHRAVAAALGEAPAPLVGYSMGGRLALAFAVAHPGRVGRLVLESASPGLATEEERAARREADEALARRIESGGIESFLDEWEAVPLFASRAGVLPAEKARQRALRRLNRPAGLAGALRGLGTGVLPSYWEDLPGLAVPTLLVVGALDAKFAGIAAEMAALLPDARLAVVPGAGHTVHLERPGAWLEAVVPFLLGG